MTNAEIRFTLNNKTYYGYVEKTMLNNNYEHGKSCTYNENKGGYTYHICAFTHADDNTRYDIYLEITSDNVTDFEIIETNELRAYIKAHQKPHDDNFEYPDFGFGGDEEA